MRYLFFLSFFAIQLSAQENLYQYDEVTYPSSTGVEYNGQVIMGFMSYKSNPGQFSPVYRFATFDLQGKLQTIKDSFDNGAGPPYGVNYIGRTDSTIFVGKSVFNSSTTVQSNSTLLELDDNWNEIHRYQVSKGSQLVIIYCALRDGNKTLIGGVKMDSSIWSSVVTLYQRDSLISEVYPAYGSNNVMSIAKFNGRYVFGHWGTNAFEILTILDTNLSVDTIIGRTQSNWQSRSYNDFVVSADGNHLYALGIYRGQAFVVAKYNKQMQELRRDTLQSIWNVNNNTHMFSELKFCDYKKADSIFMVGGWDYTGHKVYQLDSTVSAPLQVVLADTSGVFHWSRTVGDGGSAYYNPFTVVATSDGGALIFSGKYDHTHSTDPHYFLSVIKIQGNGEVLSEHEYPMSPPVDFQVYPNPVSDILRFELPDEEVAACYQIFDLKGKVVAAGSFEKNMSEIIVGQLEQGIYHLRITSSEGKPYLNRFITK